MQTGLTINEIAEKLQVGLKDIERWEILFDLQSFINENGIKYYFQDNINIFENIKRLLDEGFALEDIYIMLKSNNCENNNKSVSIADNVDFYEFNNIENKVEHSLMVKQSMNNQENTQLNIYNLFMEKTRLIENFATEKSKLMAKIEILEFKKNEIENNNNKIISFLENQINEYKELLTLKDKALRQMESHLTDYVRLKQTKKWWQNIL